MSFTSDEGNWLQCHDAAAKFAKERITDKGFTLLYDEIMSTQSFVDRG
jgi:methylmalonyl-CoA mutase cobalamin-binding subunit